MNVRPLHDRIIVDRLAEGEQQIGGIIIVPLVGVAVIQASATVLFGATSYALGAVVVLVISLLGLALGARLFGRETILTRWR